MDLVIRNATLPDGRTGIDIGIDQGRIAVLEARLPAKGASEIDAEGDLVSPPFVDAHFHMDAVLSYGLPRVNRSGTLLEGIQLWGELKPQLTQDALVERALRYCDWAVARGLLAIRTHVDICDDRLLAVEALLEVRRRVAPYLDLQLVAFPQDGVLRSPSAFANLRRAVAMGVDVVGGIPHFERTMAQGAESVRLLCEFAAGRLVAPSGSKRHREPWMDGVDNLTNRSQKTAGNHRLECRLCSVEVSISTHEAKADYRHVAAELRHKRRVVRGIFDLELVAEWLGPRCRTTVQWCSQLVDQRRQSVLRENASPGHFSDRKLNRKPVSLQVTA